MSSPRMRSPAPSRDPSGRTRLWGSAPQRKFSLAICWNQAMVSEPAWGAHPGCGT